METVIGKVALLRSLERGPMVTYLVLTVRSSAIDLLRRRGVEGRLFTGEEAGDEQSDPSAPADERLIRAENREDTKRLLEKLPESDRLVLEGRYFLELSDEELAGKLGVTGGSVRVKLTRARRHAREILEKEGTSYGDR